MNIAHQIAAQRPFLLAFARLKYKQSSTKHSAASLIDSHFYSREAMAADMERM